jgi:hypothetical protein
MHVAVAEAVRANNSHKQTHNSPRIIRVNNNLERIIMSTGTGTGTGTRTGERPRLLPISLAHLSALLSLAFLSLPPPDVATYTERERERERRPALPPLDFNNELTFLRPQMKERKRRAFNKDSSFASASKGRKATSSFFLLFAICFSVWVLTIELSNFRLHEGTISGPDCCYLILLWVVYLDGTSADTSMNKVPFWGF